MHLAYIFWDASVYTYVYVIYVRVCVYVGQRQVSGVWCPLFGSYDVCYIDMFGVLCIQKGDLDTYMYISICHLLWCIYILKHLILYSGVKNTVQAII